MPPHLAVQHAGWHPIFIALSDALIGFTNHSLAELVQEGLDCG